MMRVAVVSDTHHSFKWLPLAAEHLGKVDLLFHLGDFAPDAEQVAEAQGAALPPVSLTPAGDEESPKEYEIPVYSHEESVSDSLALEEALATLLPEDRQLIVLRFFKNQTQSEVAKKIGTTQVQVSRRERKILARLRDQLTC